MSDRTDFAKELASLKQQAAKRSSIGRAIESLERIERFAPFRDEPTETFRLPYSSAPRMDDGVEI